MMRALACACAVLALAACDREARLFSKPPSAAPSPAAATRAGDLRPGEPGEGLTETLATRTFDGKNAFEIAQGKRLFHWYNCSGCHGNGGGGMGPALMDDRWLYGSAPDEVYATIMEGRPNGMPSFRGRIPDDQAWQLVAYVRALSGQAPKSAGSARSDDLPGAVPGESRVKRMDPVTAPEQPK